LRNNQNFGSRGRSTKTTYFFIVRPHGEEQIQFLVEVIEIQLLVGEIVTPRHPLIAQNTDNAFSAAETVQNLCRQMAEKFEINSFAKKYGVKITFDKSIRTTEMFIYSRNLSDHNEKLK